MAFEKELKLLKENRIKVFRYLLVDDKIKDILTTKDVEVEDFLKKFLVLIFDEILASLEKSDKNEYPDTNILKNSSFDYKELFYFFKILRNSIHLFFYNKKIDRFILKKSIDDIFDFLFESLLEEENEKEIDEDEENKDEIDFNNFTKLIENNLLYLKIDKESKIFEISKKLQKNFKEFFSLDKKFLDYLENEALKKEFFSALSSNNSFEKEIKLYDKNSKYFWFESQLLSFYDDSGELDFFYLILEDITLKKLESREKKVFLEQSKMAAMGELISMIAHQWRQPLQTISILAQKLILTKTSNGYVDNEILEKTVDDVDVQVSYMSRTIDDFRNFFKPEDRKKIVKLSEIIDKTLKFMHYLLTINNIDIRIEIENDYEISIFENNIIQVLINLIKNSKDALLEKKIKDKFIIIRADFNENYAIIEVEDSAGGIEQENLDKIFESYFTTKNNENGTGLGLYMSKIIIEEHCQGKLSVENSENGALFKILLPLK